MENDVNPRRRLLPSRYPYFHRRSSSLPPQFQYNQHTHFTTRGSSDMQMQSSLPLPPMSGGGAGVQGGGSSAPAPTLGRGGVDGRGSSNTLPSHSLTGLARMVEPTCTPAQPSFLVNQASAYGLPPRPPQRQSTNLFGSMQQYNMTSFVDQASSSSSGLKPLPSLVNQAPPSSSSYGLPPRPPQSTNLFGSMQQYNMPSFVDRASSSSSGLQPLPTFVNQGPSSYGLPPLVPPQSTTIGSTSANLGGSNDIGSEYLYLESLFNLSSLGDDINEVVNDVAVRKEPVSYSMDNFSSVLPGGADSSRSHRSRYNVPADPLVVDFADGTFTEDERKKIMANKRLAALVLTDPQYVRRTLYNRIVSERSREKKKMHVSNLENKVALLEKETASLSTKVLSLQSMAKELMAENNVVKTKLQEMETQSQLRCALNELLSAEVQRLKRDAGETINDRSVPAGFNQEMGAQIIQPGHLEIQDLPVLQQAQAQEPQFNDDDLNLITQMLEDENFI